MEQKSGKYWPGVLLIMLFTALCARKLLPELWNQVSWQVIPARTDPIPIFGNIPPEENEIPDEDKIHSSDLQEKSILEDVPEEPVESEQVPSDRTDVSSEEISVQKSEEVNEEPWPETMLPGEQININKASATDLTRLPLVGEKRARAIVAWRRKNGPFREFEDLLGVQGIGAATLEQLKRYITL